MTQTYTNVHNISAPMAVFLAVDKYDHDPRENVTSVTSLMKSLRQVVLSKRLKAGDSQTDISNLLASRMGTAIHESVEDAWAHHHVDAMKSLGYNSRVIDSVRINPEKPDPDNIDMYLEIRSEKVVGNHIISGCADMIFNGAVHDIKSTGVFNYLTSANDAKYKLQLSLYKWLNPDKVIEDQGYIQFIFKDWNKLQSTINPDYPMLPVMEKAFTLHTSREMEYWVTSKLDSIDKLMHVPEPELPLCSDEDLWIRSSEWKYYGSVDAKRATKNFKDDKAGAYAMLGMKGKGVVKEVKAKAMACGYCPNASICSQYTNLVSQGLA